jgi:hypothetical protein
MMPRKNRVTPFGQIIATPARGTLMGNRGCLHDEQQRIRRPYQTKRWIICLLEFKGIRRTLMKPGSWTELFFLDEATALAAGHRPCAYCQRDRFELFRAHWAAANPTLAGTVKPLVDTIDHALHEERINRQKGKIVFPVRLLDLPSGVLFTDEKHSAAYLWWHEQVWRWQPAGYTLGEIASLPAVVQVLTPRSTVNTLQHGYPVAVHPSAVGQTKSPQPL